MSETERIPPTQKVEPLVRYVLRSCPSSREAGKGGDKLLTWRIYQIILSKHKYPLTPQQFEVLLAAPTPESIRRTRQKIHEAAEKGGPTHKDYWLLPKDKRKSAHAEAERWRDWSREGQLLREKT